MPIAKFHHTFGLMVVLVSFLTFPSRVAGLTHEITSGSDWSAGTLNNIDTLSREGDISLSADGTWGARSWKSPDLVLSVGSAFTTDGTNIYATRGLGDVRFWKYDSLLDQWSSLTNLPHGAYYGSELEYLDGYIYALFGGYQKTFARYSIATNSWQTLENINDFVYSGASLTSDGTDIYALRGNNSQDFYKYSVSENTWSPLSGTPATVGAGADLVRVGNYIYTPRGNNSTVFYRYDLTAGTWSTRASLPASLNDDMEISSDGTYIYVARQGNTTTFYRYSIAGNSWSTLTSLPAAARYAGTVYLPSEGNVYVFRGNGQYDFWKYDPDTDAFLGPEDAPATLGTGSDMLRVGNYLYVLRGANTTTLYRYDLNTGGWSTMANAPAGINDDVKGVVAGSLLYFYRGGNTSTFYSYNTSTNTWSTLANTPSSVRFGGALSYPGTGDIIYGTRGNTTGTFWTYSISGNAWDDTASDLPADAESSYGSRLISDGTDIYYVPGIGIKRFFKYSIAGDSWEEMSPVPFSPYYGSDIEYHDGSFVALAGWYNNEVYEYSIAGNTWRRLPSLAGYRAQDIGPYNGASIVFDGNASFYISRGSSLSSLLLYTPGTSKYHATGSWISASIDLQHVASWSGLTAVDTKPGNATITYQTRSSSNGTDWSVWQTVSGTTIASPVQRYLQVKAIFTATSDGTQTPTTESITIDYTGDQTAPSNPTTINAFATEIAGDPLTSGVAYAHINPYFTWSGAADDATTVSGYHVYFGTNAVADPTSVGSYQTSSSYLVTKPLSTGTYVLRISTVDAQGNISAPETVFTYVYAGISPPQSITASETVDFLGVTENTSIQNDHVHLNPQLGGFWEQSTLSFTPASMQYGAKTIAHDENEAKLYAFRGSNSTIFYSYDIAQDSWSTLAPAPANVRIGGGVIEGPDGYLFGLRGNNTTAFWRYDIAENTWSDEAASDAPLTIYYGASMVFDTEQFIYVSRGNNDDVFWRYDTLSDNWESLAMINFGAPQSAVNNNVYRSADLAIDVENELIYATQGNYRPGFAVYDINTNIWTPLPDLPALAYDGSSIEYVPSQEAVYFTAGGSSELFFKYDVADETWSQVASAPALFNYGATLRDVGGQLYAITAGNTNGFYRYDTAKDSWKVPNRGLFGREFQGVVYKTAHYGADVLKGDGQNYYLIRGNYADDFVRWNEETGQTTRLANLPIGAYQGSSLVYDDTSQKIYYSASVYVDKFYVYDIASNTWSEISTDPLPISFGYGTSMVFDSSRYIYASRGNNSNAFYRYDLQASPGNRWSQLTNFPATIGYGAELLLNSDYIYSLRGQNAANNPFYQYSIADNSWSDPTVADLSIDVNYGGFLVDGGNGSFYAARGENDTDFFQYSQSDNTWTQLDDSPARISYGGSAESNGVNKIYVLAGAGTSSYADAIYSYVLETNESSYVESGTYTTQSHDLTNVYRWAGLDVDVQLPTNTDITISTRSSADNQSWSSWTAAASEKVSGANRTYQIKSPPNRYIQVQFVFSSADGVRSPSIDTYTINYYSDTTAPSNPALAGFSAYSQSASGSPIVTDTWYNYSNPHFDWPDAEETHGASDTSSGSGVSGYYVYFGTNAGADPLIDGAFQTESSYTASSIQPNSTNYLIIQTIDDAGNLAEETWQPFIYKFDNEAPAPPTLVTADPTGYTATNSFDFSWQEASGSGSTVSEYCYKTGASAGQYATDQCVNALSIQDVPSYKVGSNTFFVRSRDSAGNTSPYANVSYFYVDSDNAPAPPQNLTATPTSSTTNSFAFSWDLPPANTYYGAAANLKYYYSINAVPTPNNTTPTSVRSLQAGAFATQPGQNTIYVATMDEAGNINYANYASATFEANTVAPGIPLNIDIADVSVKSTSSWKLALSWEAPASVGSGIASYNIFRSVDGSTFTKVGSSGGISFVDVGLTQQEYYYKAQACDSTNNCGAFSEVVSLFPDGKFTSAATLISDPAISDITTRKATVTWYTDRTSDSKIAYGVASGEYFDEEVSNSTQVTLHTLNLTNLLPGTTYYYVVRWTDEDGNTGESAEQTFATLPAPSTEEPTATSIGLDSALIEFTSRNASKVRVYYGETSAFGGTKELIVGSAEGRYAVQLTDLADGTKYFYKISSFDSDGVEYEGETHSFSTLPRPKISSVQVNQVKGTARSTLLITWVSNTEINSVVTYYPSSNPGAARDEVNVALKSGLHQIILSDLEPQASYTILISGKDVIGNEAVSEVLQVTTSADTRPPQISELRVEGEIIGSGEEATAQIVVSFSTDEPSTSQIEFGEGSGSTYSQKTQEDGSLTNNHLVVISGLTPAKVYHLRAIARDEHGNQADSADKVIITPKATENALDLVMTSLLSVFGPLR